MFVIQGSINNYWKSGAFLYFPAPSHILPPSFINSFHKWLLCTIKPESILDIKNTKISKTR